MSKQPEALRLAEILVSAACPYPVEVKAAELLRRQHALIEQLAEALQFILAFYEPGQTYLDTNAWKQAEEGGRAALAEYAKESTR